MSVAMAVAFRWSPWKEYTGRMNLTMRMHMAIYAFLFVKGTQYVISCFLDHFFINNGVVSIYQWFYGPIYVFPTAFFLWYHNRIKRKLGRGVFVVLSVILSVFLLLRGVFCPDLVSFDFLIMLSLVSHDVLMTFSWLSHEFLTNLT